MPNYRRLTEPGGIYFFTLVTYKRRPIFQTTFARKLLGDCLRACRESRPYQIEGIVLLPDHLHAIWTLPPHDNDYSQRWAFIKSEFTRRWIQSGGAELKVSGAASQRERRRGAWQPRFREHMIREEEDFERLLDYIHYNPVKHGYVKCPLLWPASSFRRWAERGA